MLHPGINKRSRASTCSDSARSPTKNVCISSSHDDHLAKKILPISSRKGNTNTIRAEDQPEDILIWARNERPTSLSQWLARQVSITQAVDPAYRVEPVERSWRLNTELPLQVGYRLPAVYTQINFSASRCSYAKKCFCNVNIIFNHYSS